MYRKCPVHRVEATWCKHDIGMRMAIKRNYKQFIIGFQGNMYEIQNRVDVT